MSCPATFYAIQGGNDLHWRVEAPAKAIGARTCILPEIGAGYSILRPNEDSIFPWIETEQGADYPAHEGKAAVWTRPDLARATHARAMRQCHGIRIIAEVDDNYLALPKFNHFMRANGWNAQLKDDHMRVMASFDGIIVTTDWLKNRYFHEIKSKFGFCPDIFVCGNYVDFDKVPESITSKGARLRVGFMGSDVHRWDIKMVFPALKWAADAGHRVILIGHDPKWRRFFDYEHIPWRDSDEFRKEPLPLDIGLAPLLSNDHTFGKTDIKFLEYSLAGAASICSNNQIYNKTVKHGENGLLASSREEFWIWTQRLCNDRKLRETLVHSAQQYVREERDIKDHIYEWREAIEGG